MISWNFMVSLWQQISFQSVFPFYSAQLLCNKLAILFNFDNWSHVIILALYTIFPICFVPFLCLSVCEVCIFQSDLYFFNLANWIGRPCVRELTDQPRVAVPSVNLCSSILPRIRCECTVNEHAHKHDYYFFAVNCSKIREIFQQEVLAKLKCTSTFNRFHLILNKMLIIKYETQLSLSTKHNVQPFWLISFV